MKRVLVVIVSLLALIVPEAWADKPTPVKPDGETVIEARAVLLKARELAAPGRRRRAVDRRIREIERRMFQPYPSSAGDVNSG